MRIISIANQKGGCGKTTTTINLASTLAMNGYRILLIDLDPQAHASLGLNIDSQDSIYNVISKLTPRRLKIENIIQGVEQNFDIAPSNLMVGTLEQELADEIGRELKLIGVLAPLEGRYDYILIDCPPSLGFLTVNAIRASQEVIIPVETSRFAMQGVERLMDIVNLIRDRLNHTVQCRLLITMFDSRLRHSFAMLDKLRDKFNGMLLNTIIHLNVKLKESVVFGQTVTRYDKYCRGSKDYFSLAKELISRDKIARQEEAGKTERIIERALEKTLENQEFSSGSALSNRMQEIIKTEAHDIFLTTFTLDAPQASSVYVTGSFNDWSLDESCRMKMEDSQWKISIRLNPGIHKYQFIIDGKWQQDPLNPLQERNSFGDINSLVEVKANGDLNGLKFNESSREQ